MNRLEAHLNDPHRVDTIQKATDTERLLYELQRMAIAGFLPSSVDVKNLQGYQVLVGEWLDIFSEADLFVSEHEDLIKGANIISESQFHPATRHTRIADAYLITKKPPTYMYSNYSFLIPGDHPAMEKMRESLIQSLFILPGEIADFSIPKHNLFVEDATVEARFPGRGFTRLWSAPQYNIPKAGKDSFLIFNKNLMIATTGKGTHPNKKEISMAIELQQEQQSIQLFIDMFDTVDIAQIIARKVTNLQDESIDVRTLRIHPYPVFVHYESKSNLITYEVPLYHQGLYRVIPGSQSPDSLIIPFTQNLEQSFGF